MGTADWYTYSNLRAVMSRVYKLIVPTDLAGPVGLLRIETSHEKGSKMIKTATGAQNKGTQRDKEKARAAFKRNKESSTSAQPCLLDPFLKDPGRSSSRKRGKSEMRLRGGPFSADPGR